MCVTHRPLNTYICTRVEARMRLMNLQTKNTAGECRTLSSATQRRTPHRKLHERRAWLSADRPRNNLTDPPRPRPPPLRRPPPGHLRSSSTPPSPSGTPPSPSRPCPRKASSEHPTSPSTSYQRAKRRVSASWSRPPSRWPRGSPLGRANTRSGASSAGPMPPEPPSWPSCCRPWLPWPPPSRPCACPSHRPPPRSRPSSARTPS
mmetsp:Transcript_13856/g.37063  ORF Transcript_13856/g.37063 Transcript_13856/m.37063 type:complete len:205 (-) Transcript_13856:267-881(-)